METSTPKEVFNSKASAYAERFMDQSKFHGGLNQFLDNLESTKPKILDVGCGPGNIAKYLLDKNPAINLIGVDIAPNMLKIAQSHCPSAVFQELDAKNIVQLAQTFDGIVLGFCLPYLSKSDAIQLVKNATKILNTNGTLYLSTMEDLNKNSHYQGPSSGKGPALFINFHEESYLKDALTSNGMKTIFSTRIKDEASGNTDLIFLAKKH